MTLIAVLAITLAACGDDDDDDDDNGETPAPTGDETPEPTEPPDGERIQGGDLVVRSIEPQSLDPHFSSFSQDISLHRMLWRGLYSLNAENEPEPAIAADMPDISDDGLTYTITLKEGLQWSDGDDLLAEDFVAGIHRTCNPDNAGEYQYILTNVVGCDDHYGNEAGYDADLEAAIGVAAIDDTTFEISIIEEQPTFTIILSLWMTFPSPVHLLPNSSDPWPDPAPNAPGQLAYNGPYVLTGFSPGVSAELEPNPNWSGDVQPTLDTLTLRFVEDAAVAVNAYRNNEIHSTNADEAQLAAQVAEFDPAGQYTRVIFPGTVGLQMQMELPILGENFDVRLALSRAIDRATLNTVCYGDGRIATTTWVPEATGGVAPDFFADVIGFDPDAAQQALADAGYEGGAGFPTLTVLVRDTASARCEAEFYQENFSTILGIDIEIQVVDGPTRSARFGSEEFELFPGGWIQDYPDPENWIIGLFDSAGTLNHYNCVNDEIDAKVEEARFNTDNDARLQLYTEINELIVTELCGIAPTLHLANHYFIKPEVVGMREFAAGQDALIAGDWAAEQWGFSE